jgi:hypothetical protein
MDATRAAVHSAVEELGKRVNAELPSANTAD